MAKMYGYARGDELVDRPLRELLSPKSRAARTTCARSSRTDIGWRRSNPTTRARRPDARVPQQPGGRGRGRPAAARVGHATDVTAEVEAREQAEAGNRAKDEFLALLGHELRNPLSPILTALQLMRLRDAEALARAAIIERQVEHVVRLVDDLLDVSRITRGMVSLERRQGRPREGGRTRDRAGEPAARAARAPPLGRPARRPRRRRGPACGFRRCSRTC